MGLRSATYRAFFGLIAAAGLRLSEAINLQRSDVDLTDGVLTIRRTKICKNAHRSPCIRAQCRLCEAMQSFEIKRFPRQRMTSSFFRLAGQPSIFARWSTPSAVYASSSAGSGEVITVPRIVDMRHSFICRRLVSWYKQGVNVDNAILALATYVGHTGVTGTYWYITGVADLMAIARSVFKAWHQGVST